MDSLVPFFFIDLRLINFNIGLTQLADQVSLPIKGGQLNNLNEGYNFKHLNLKGSTGRR